MLMAKRKLTSTNCSLLPYLRFVRANNEQVCSWLKFGAGGNWILLRHLHSTLSYELTGLHGRLAHCQGCTLA